jgi:hypothetical protein
VPKYIKLGKEVIEKEKIPANKGLNSFLRIIILKINKRPIGINDTTLPRIIGSKETFKAVNKCKTKCKMK